MRPSRPASRTRSRASRHCSREMVVVVTRQPKCCAACSARPPQPVPISSRWSVGLELELPADAIEPRDLRVVQRLPRMLERRGRVHHRLVEEQPEEIVAEVVVRGDVAARAGAAVAAERVHGLAQRRGEAREPAFEPVERVHVEHEQPHDVDELRRGPVAAHVRLARADRAAECHVAVEPRIVHVDDDRLRQRRAGLAETMPLRRPRRARGSRLRSALQLGEHGAPAERIEHAGARAARSACSPRWLQDCEATSSDMVGILEG